MAYFASFYLTFFLHLTPIDLSGRILDTFMIFEHNFVDHMLLGLLEKNKKLILEIDRQDQLLKYIKYQMVKDNLLESGGISKLFLGESLNLFKNGKIGDVQMAIRQKKDERRIRKNVEYINGKL